MRYFRRMIRKRLAVELHNKLYPVDRSQPKDDLKRQQLGAVSVHVKCFTEEFAENYTDLGDVRQSVLVVLAMRSGLQVAEELLKTMGDNPVVSGAAITSSNWGKRKANKAAAKALRCQWESNELCKGAEGCGCNG